MNLSLGHMIVLLIIVLLVVGPNRLEGVGISLGKAIRGFKKGMEGGLDDEPVQKTTVVSTTVTKTEPTEPKI